MSYYVMSVTYRPSFSGGHPSSMLNHICHKYMHIFETAGKNFPATRHSVPIPLTGFAVAALQLCTETEPNAMTATMAPAAMKSHHQMWILYEKCSSQRCRTSHDTGIETIKATAIYRIKSRLSILTMPGTLAPCTFRMAISRVLLFMQYFGKFLPKNLKFNNRVG